MKPGAGEDDVNDDVNDGEAAAHADVVGVADDTVGGDGGGATVAVEVTGAHDDVVEDGCFMVWAPFPAGLCSNLPRFPPREAASRVSSVKSPSSSQIELTVIGRPLYESGNRMTVVGSSLTVPVLSRWAAIHLDRSKNSARASGPKYVVVSFLVSFRPPGRPLWKREVTMQR